jgi:ubiquinone/menaquinone biosynthesis C-methylase UbiE
VLAPLAERATAAGLDTVEFVQGDAEQLAFAAGSFDAILSSFPSVGTVPDGMKHFGHLPSSFLG